MLLVLLLKLLLVLSREENAELRLAETIRLRLLNNTEAAGIRMLIVMSLPAPTEVASMRGSEVESKRREEVGM